MSEEKSEEDPLFGPFKQFLDALGVGASPASMLSTDLMGRLFEIQRSMLQEALGSGTEGGGASKHEREAVKALMQCSLEVMQSTRDYRERVIKAQTDFLERYARLIEEALDKPPEGAESPSSRKAPGKKSSSKTTDA